MINAAKSDRIIQFLKPSMECNTWANRVNIIFYIFSFLFPLGSQWKWDFEFIQMIKKILKALGLHVYAKFIREKYFPALSQQNEKNFIPARVKFYKQFLSPGNLCFDIGANIGNRTRVFLQLGATV